MKSVFHSKKEIASVNLKQSLNAESPRYAKLSIYLIRRGFLLGIISR